MTTDVELLSPKAVEILTTTQMLIQTRGYNGFSFRDIAEEVGVKSASIHYHFPTKVRLAVVATQIYRENFGEALTALEQESPDAIGRLRGYAGFFDKTLNENDRICLCAMLASDADALPDAVLEETRLFFDDQLAWIEDVLKQGVEKNEIQCALNPEKFAKVFLSALEGGMVVFRNMGKKHDLNLVAEELISLLHA